MENRGKFSGLYGLKKGRHSGFVVRKGSEA